jgi:hypothetical protein
MSPVHIHSGRIQARCDLGRLARLRTVLGDFNGTQQRALARRGRARCMMIDLNGRVTFEAGRSFARRKLQDFGHFVVCICSAREMKAPTAAKKKAQRRKKNGATKTYMDHPDLIFPSNAPFTQYLKEHGLTAETATFWDDGEPIAPPISSTIRANDETVPKSGGLWHVIFPSWTIVALGARLCGEAMRAGDAGARIRFVIIPASYFSLT